MVYDGGHCEEEVMTLVKSVGQRFDMVEFMLMRFIPTVCVSGPLVGLRLAVQRYRQGSVGNGRCLPC